MIKIVLSSKRGIALFCYCLVALILCVGIVQADTYNWVRGESSFDNIYCLLTGCTITGNLVVDGNLTVEGSFVNVTVVDYNVTGSLDVNGPVTATNFSGTLFWNNLSAYPAACGAGEFVSAVGDSLTCAVPSDNDTNTHVAGNPPYLSNDSTTMYFNETKLNETIDARENDTNTHVNGSPPWLSNDSTTMYFNETHFNTSVTGLQFWQASANANDIYYGDLTDDYFVGIGDTTPDGKLDISETDNDTRLIIDNSDLTASDYDPMILLSLEEDVKWNMCVDESDEDKLKIIDGSDSCSTSAHMEFSSDVVSMGTIFTHAVGTLPADATPSVAGGNVFLTSILGATITTFDDGIPGMVLIIMCANPSTRINNGATLHLNGNFRCGVSGIGSNDRDTLTLVASKISATIHWFELSRSDNT